MTDEVIVTEGNWTYRNQGYGWYYTPLNGAAVRGPYRSLDAARRGSRREDKTRERGLARARAEAGQS